jgi:hypothetical protein
MPTLVMWVMVVPARDGSGIFTICIFIYGCLTIVPYILYYIIIFIDFLFLGSLSFNVIVFRQASQNVYKNIILFTHEYDIVF